MVEEADGSVPELVYHYTGPDGLAGILLGREIWATDLRYLNDSTEYEYLFARLSHRSAALDNAPAEAIAMTQAAQRIIAGLSRFYVACFCKSDDLLSQWRGYAGGIGGFAIGLRWSRLKIGGASDDRRSAWRFERVVYDQHTQDSTIDDILRTSMRAAIESQVGIEPIT